jgi:hypothetical protein
MKQLLLALLTAVTVTALAGIAQAQYGPGGRYRPAKVSALIDHVHEDFNVGIRIWHMSIDDREKLRSADRQLQEFARQWQHGRFQAPILVSSLALIERVLDTNRVAGREREALEVDLDQLRQMKEAFAKHEVGTK